MGEQKLFNYELSDEMKRYLKDTTEQMENKEGAVYEEIINDPNKSADEGYIFAIDQGYDLDREEFEKLANDFTKFGAMATKEDGELDLELLEMVAGGMSDTGEVVYTIGFCGVCTGCVGFILCSI
jgi:flagellar biosynthesis/type III secretory pathway protein FliH